MEKSGVSRWVTHFLSLQGFSIDGDAKAKLVKAVIDIDESMRQTFMKEFLKYLDTLKLNSDVINLEQVTFCLEEGARSAENSKQIWEVINIFEVPKFIYSKERKKVIKDESTEVEDLFPNAEKKILLYRRRYDLIMQRTLRHDLFRQQNGLGKERRLFFLNTVEWFLCSSERIENAVIVGLLVQKNETVYAIEDLTGSLELDLSKAKFHDGFFPEHCFVLIEGVYDDEVFYVQDIGFPPSESAMKTKKYLAEFIDQSPGLASSIHFESMMLFISDVWLDKIEVIDKLADLFSALNLNPPVAIFLMGNFLYSHEGSKNAENLKKGFKTLGEIIARARNIAATSNVVLIPGPSDLGAPHILPRPPLPEVLCRDLKKLVPRAVLATNPCRIQYCDKKIVIIREDLIKKMCRNTIHFPKTDDIPMHFAKTIVSQANLVPLSLNVAPIYWNYSHCLDIYPLPDLIVTADDFKTFNVKHMDCPVINPGPFMKNGFSFHTYLPAVSLVREASLRDHRNDDE